MRMLDVAELTELTDLIPSLGEDGRQAFERAAQRIFNGTVENLLTAGKCDGSPALHARDQLLKLQQSMAQARDVVEGLDEAMMRLLDAQLSELATLAQSDRVGTRITSDKWRRDILRLLDLILGVGERFEITPVRRESGTVYRQMVRGLAVCVAEIAGDPPRRTFKIETDHTSQSGDQYLVPGAIPALRRSGACICVEGGKESCPRSAVRPHRHRSGGTGRPQRPPGTSGAKTEWRNKAASAGINRHFSGADIWHSQKVIYRGFARR